MTTPDAARPVLLVVDDDPAMLRLLERFATTENFEVITRSGGERLIEEWPVLQPDVALLDRQMPEIGGIDILRRVRTVDPDCQVILMTGDATLESAVEAIKLGALDYLPKPLDFARLAELLEGVRQQGEQRQRILATEAELARRVEFCGIVGRSPAMLQIFDLIRRMAPHARTTLVTGETGTGKELVARAFHQLGPRRERRFLTFNCSAVVETLFESELFGHARGAFTGAVDAKAGLFEVADKGTLFLDEVGELPLPVQAKMLRVLEYGDVQRVGSNDSRKVDVRIVAATNRHLPDEVAAGRFRQDLYYRLNLIEIELPPLRARREDIPLLVAAAVREFAARFSKPLAGVSPGAERLLYHAPWPGNIRELRNVVERACILSEGRILSEADVLASLRGTARAAAEGLPALVEPPVEEEKPLDRATLERALQRAGGNRSEVARELGLSRRALYRRLDSFGLR